MIKKLSIKKFGKFKNESFNLSNVNVFVGENESGKTTIFDSLFHALCTPSGTTVPGKRLNRRYGEDREVSLGFSDDEITFDQDEFLNLYAIHSGDVDIDFESGKKWIDKIKASIFTGGIDPLKLAADLEKTGSLKGTLKHVKDLNKKEKEYEEIREKVNILFRKKEEILSQESGVKDIDSKVSELKKQINVNEKKIDKLKFKVDQQEKIKDKKNLLSNLKLIKEVDSQKQEIEDLKLFKEDKKNNADILIEQKEDVEDKLKAVEVEISIGGKNIGDFDKKINNIKDENFKNEKFARLAGEFLSVIEKERPRAQMKIITSWNKMVIAGSILPFISGITGSFFISQFEMKIISFLVGSIIALIMIFFSRKQSQEEELPRENQFINKIKDDWRIRSNEKELSSKSIDGLVRELIDFQSSSDKGVSLLESIITDRNRLNDKQNILISDREKLKKEYELKGKLFQDWLSEMSVKNISEYIVKRQEYISKNNELIKNKNYLKEVLLRKNISDKETLRVEVERELNNLDREISEKELNEVEVNLLEKKFYEEVRNNDLLKEKERQLSNKLNKDEGIVEGSIKGLPEEIHECKSIMVKLQKEIIDMNRLREADKLASDIFYEIAKDSDLLFHELASDISNIYGNILSKDGSVSVNSFNLGAIQVADKEGVKRDIDLLSKGTRDSFVFALRLSFALRNRGEDGGILILDEPFHSLDVDRVKGAVKMLKKFYDEYKWQLIFFTKDDYFTKIIKSEFKKLEIHSL